MTSIRTQLTSAFLSIVLFIALIALAGYTGIFALSGDLSAIDRDNQMVNAYQRLAGLVNTAQLNSRDLIENRGQAGLRDFEGLRDFVKERAIFSRRDRPAEQQVLMYFIETSVDDYIRSFGEDFLSLWEKQNLLLSASVGQTLSNDGNVSVERTQGELASYASGLNRLQHELQLKQQRLGLAVDTLDRLFSANIDATIQASNSYGRRVRLIMLAASIVALGWSLGIALLYSRHLTKAIRHIVHTMQEISTGRLTAKMNASSRDEIGALGANCNNFLTKLSEIIAGIRGGVVASLGQNQSLLEAMTGTGASSDEINSLARDVQAVIERQSGIIEEVSANVEEIARTIEQQDDKIDRQASAVGSGTVGIETLIKNIQEISGQLDSSAAEFSRLLKVTGEGHDNINRLKTIIQALDDQSDSVIAANDIVKSIASQTNLLSMNAAIEAAHAGQAGLGFAVVADEIRKLAEVANEQSKFISDNLSQLKRSIEQVVAMSDTTGSSFEVMNTHVQAAFSLQRNIQSDIAEQAEKGGATLEVLGQVGQITQEVRDGSREIRSSSQTVIEEIASLVTISHQVGDAAQGVTGKAALVQRNAAHALELLNDNIETTRELDEKVAFFVIDEAACLGRLNPTQA